jgi:urea transporter
MSSGTPSTLDRRAAAEALLRVYAQILFSRSPAVGLLLLLATATSPRAFVFGVLGVTAATATALLLDIEFDAVLDGSYGYNALLVGLGVGQTFAGAAPPVFATVVAAVASVFVTAALRAFLGASVNLPVLSLPFIVVYHLTLGSAAFAGLTEAAPAAFASPLAAALPAQVVLFVKSLGALFFLPRFEAGLLVLLALLVHSRISALLAAASSALLALLDAQVLSLPAGAVEGLGYNVILTGISLGAVWFVPSLSSVALALLGALVCTLVSIGTLAMLGRLGAPALILPFNITVLLLLAAMRRRTHDQAPRSVDFISGTPEQNLSYFRTRRARFQRQHPVAFRMPFRGRWVCTQAVDGALTHRGPWRHAFDFEARGEDGRLFHGDGAKVEDYHAHRLPVLAAAAGTVVQVESSVEDNPAGAINVEQNWGNHVLVHHAPGLYSLVAHLAKGTVKVKKGEVVQEGDVLGLCGNSGRSAQPHVHFHLQGTAVVGEATLPCRFSDVVIEREGRERVELSFEPRQGDVTRNIEPDDDLAAYFTWSYGDVWTFHDGRSEERVACDLDVLGSFLLRSLDREATLYFGKGEGFFTTHDAVGDTVSVLYALRAALSRVPLEGSESLSWVDTLPARDFRAWPVRVLADFFSPFLPSDGVIMEYRMRRAGPRLVVEGESRRKDRRGAPLIRTRAELQRGGGPACVEVTVRGRKITAERDARALSTLKWA